MKIRLTTILYLLLALAGLVSFFIIRNYDNRYIIDILYIIISLVLIYQAVRYIRIFGSNLLLNKSFTFIWVAIIIWIIGGLFFEFYLMFGQTIYLNISDILFVFAYIPFAYGLYLEIKQNKISLYKINKTSKILIHLLIIIICAITIFLSITKIYSPTASLIQNFIFIIYIIGDLILGIMTGVIAILILEYKGGKLASIWAGILTGIFFIYIADLFFGIYYYEYINKIWPFLNLDILLLLALIIFSFSFSKIFTFTDKAKLDILRKNI